MKPISPFVKVAAWSWIMLFIYFIAQIVVAAAWHPAYDWRGNYISDLGNTVCGMYSHQFVCSPRHTLMNIVFVGTGALIFLGGFLFALTFRRHKAAFVGFLLLALGGIGSIIVGFVPENTNLPLHSLGALLPFLFGNIGLLVIGLSRLMKTKWLRLYTIVIGCLAVSAFFLLSAHAYLGLKAGGMERLTDFTQVIWMMTFGFVVLHKNKSDV